MLLCTCLLTILLQGRPCIVCCFRVWIANTQIEYTRYFYILLQVSKESRLNNIFKRLKICMYDIFPYGLIFLHVGKTSKWCQKQHFFSNLVITGWKIQIFFSVISVSSNCNFTNNTKHKCTTDLFCWICKSRLSIIKFANFVSIIIIISWLFSEPTEKCNALNLFWQLFF